MILLTARSSVDTTTVIAVYAAIIATGGLGWHVFSYFHQRKSKVSVIACMAIYGFDADTVVAVQATNRSQHSVRVSGVGLNLQDGSGRTFVSVFPKFGATLPGEIQPYDSGTAYFDLGEVERAGINVKRPIEAWVTLATGENLRSDRRPLMQD